MGDLPQPDNNVLSITLWNSDQAANPALQPLPQSLPHPNNSNSGPSLSVLYEGGTLPLPLSLSQTQTQTQTHIQSIGIPRPTGK